MRSGPERDATSMRVCCVTTVLAALALRCAAEPASWRERERPRVSHDRDRAVVTFRDRDRTLYDLFERERGRAPLTPAVLYTERRRSRHYNKRTPQIPLQIASQMMLRASRSPRVYDVPKIGKSNSLILKHVYERSCCV